MDFYIHNYPLRWRCSLICKIHIKATRLSKYKSVSLSCFEVNLKSQCTKKGEAILYPELLQKRIKMCGTLCHKITSYLQCAATRSRWFLARGFFYPEDGGETFLRNVGSHKIYTAPHPRHGILHSHRCENLKSYIIKWGFIVYVNITHPAFQEVCISVFLAVQWNI
jgi:hypothetical protein